MSDPQTRRSFLGLISAVSAALASGVRLPGAEGSKAAETAPVELPPPVRPPAETAPVELPPPVRPPDRTPAGLLAMLRELLPQCVAVSWEQNIITGGVLETIVTYRSNPEQAKSNRNPLGVDLDRVESGWPTSVTINDTVPMDDIGHLGDRYRKFEARKPTRELTIVWR